MKTLTKFSALLVFCQLYACTSDNEPSNEYRPLNLSLKSQKTIEASNQFGFNVMAELADEKTDNLMISPLSISQALGMTWNGASGTTYDEMTSVLCLPDEEDVDINQAVKEIKDALLSADRKVELGIGNSIWYRDTYSIADDFINVNQQCYDATVKALDFTESEKSKKTINNWVDDNTNGRISKIVDNVTYDHVMFLINAVYFKGKWTYQFEKKDTQERPFHLLDKSTIDVPTMFVEADLKYSRDESGQYVSIPYGNSHFEMLIALPNEETNLQDVITSLDDTFWKTIVDNLETRGIVLYLPKFTFKNDIRLNQTLIDLGMPLAFSDVADFRRMNANGTPNLKISKVKHKTFVEVNEEGTEAAAVTSVEMINTSVGPGVMPLT